MADTAKSTFILDGQQAISEYDKLISKNNELREARDKALLSNDLDGWKKYDQAIKDNDKSIRSFKKAAFDTEAVLKNLNGSTLKDLEKTARILKERLSGMTRGTEEWKKSSEDLSKVRSEISTVNTEMGVGINKGAGFSGVWSKIGGIVSTVSGAIASAYGAIKFGQSIIASSESLSDRWAKTTTGLTFAWDSFKNSIATADFSNLFTNMRNAIKLGQEYAETLDNIEDRQRGLTVAEAKAQKELSDLRVKMNDVNLTAKGRQAYADAIIKKEQELANLRVGIAKDDLAAYTKTIVGIKNVSQADLEAFIEFKGNTEEKVALADEYNKKLRELNALNKEVATPYGTVPKTPETIRQIQSLQAEIKATDASIVSMANVLNKISPKEIETLTQKTVEYYNAQANVSQVVESTLNKQNKLELKEQKVSEQQLTNLEKYKAEIEKLRNKIEDLKLASQPVPQSLIDDFVNKSNNLFVLTQDIETLGKAVKELTFDWSQLEKEFDSETFKQIKQEAEDIADEIWKTANAITEEDSANFQKNFDEKLKRTQEWVTTTIESARSISNAVFDIIAQNDQAALDHKLSLLDQQKEKELANKDLTEKQKNDIEDKYRKKAAALKREAFIKQRNADIIQNIMNTALAVTAALTSVPPNPAMAVLAGITGAAQTAVIATQPIPEFAQGRYNVKGMSGNRYNADYTGPTVTGLYSRPAIVAETGSEIIIDPYTTRNLQLNFPDVIRAINDARRPFSGSSSVSTTSGNQQVSLRDSAFIAAVGEFTRAVDQLKTGVPAKVFYNDLEEMTEKASSIKELTNM